MGLSDLFAAIARFFERARTSALPPQPPKQAPVAVQPPPVSPSPTPSAAPAPAHDASMSPQSHAAPSIPATVGPAVEPAKVDIPAPAEPTWLDLCRPMTQHFENCFLKAYPDPASPLAVALQRAGLWQQVLRGAAIPTGERFQGLSADPWTCGWGSTGAGIEEGTTWTQGYADDRLDAGLAAAADVLDRAVHVVLTAAQKAALVDLLYNVGPGRAAHGSDPGRDGIVVLASGEPSTLLRALNAGNYAGCSTQILVWDKAAGAVMAGLELRRKANYVLFTTGTWSPA